MKPFLGIDLTENKKNEAMNGEEFITARPSALLDQALNASTDQAIQAIDQAQLPLGLRILEWVCGIFAAIVFSGTVRAITDSEDPVSLAQAYANAPWLFWAGGICLVIWLVLLFAGAKKSKTVLESEENDRLLSNLDQISASIERELGVPADAPEVDILSFCYKIKNDQVKVCERAMQMTSHFNPIFRVYSDVENLYLVNLEAKYAFPLSSLVGIHTVKKSIRVPEWNKEPEISSSQYKPYKLSTDNYGCVHMKTHHILELSVDGQSWGIYFPNYELPAMEAATGLKAQSV